MKCSGQGKVRSELNLGGWTWFLPVTGTIVENDLE